MDEHPKGMGVDAREKPLDIPPDIIGKILVHPQSVKFGQLLPFNPRLGIAAEQPVFINLPWFKRGLQRTQIIQVNPGITEKFIDRRKRPVIKFCCLEGPELNGGKATGQALGQSLDDFRRT